MRTLMVSLMQMDLLPICRVNSAIHTRSTKKNLTYFNKRHTLQRGTATKH